jgi:predicted ATPase
VESFDRYPFSLPTIRSLEQVGLRPRMTFFIGENGSGKKQRGLSRPVHLPMRDRRISKVAYEDTEHFQVTRDFLSNSQRMLEVLLER